MTQTKEKQAEPTLGTLIDHYEAELQKIEQLQAKAAKAKRESARLDDDAELDPGTIVTRKRRQKEIIEDSEATIAIIRQRLEPTKEEIPTLMIEQARAWDAQVRERYERERKMHEKYLESEHLRDSVKPFAALLWIYRNSTDPSSQVGKEVAKLLDEVKPDAETAAKEAGIEIPPVYISAELDSAIDMFPGIHRVREIFSNNEYYRK